MSDETTLLPCPWCGEYPKVAEDGGSTGPWFCVWHDCPPVEGGKARHYGESFGCISITTAWFHTEAEAIAAWNIRAAKPCYATDYTHEHCKYSVNRGWVENVAHGTLTAEQVMHIHETIEKHWHDLPADYDMPEATALPEYSYDWQAIADELNATLGGGECEFVIEDNMNESEGMGDVWFRCTNCNTTFEYYADDWLMKQNYCPHCGFKIRKAVKR